MRKSFPHIRNQPVNKCKILYENGEIVLTNRGLFVPQTNLQERYDQIKNHQDYMTVEREVGARSFVNRRYGIPYLR